LSRFPLCLKKIFEKLFESFNLIIFPFEVAVYQNKYKDVPTIYHNDDSAHDVGWATDWSDSIKYLPLQ